MPSHITKYRLFVASPGDLTEERASVKDVVDELNLSFGNANGLYLELVRWETHASPGFRPDGPQEVINQDVGGDYDLFIGLLWTRFGTPTRHYSSGTEEEFRRAKERFDSNPDSVQLLMYFKNSSPNSLSDIDPAQLERVNSFRSSLGNKGGFYWDFTTVQELQYFLRLHIPRRIQDLMKAQRSGTLDASPVPTREPSQVTENETEHGDSDDDLGTLDYEIEISESLGEGTKAMIRIGEATKEMSEGLNKRTNEADALLAQNHRNPLEMRMLSQRTAAVLNNFSARLDSETNLFYDNFKKGIEATSALCLKFPDQLNDNTRDELTTSLQGVMNIIDENLSSVRGMHNAISKMPRLEKGLNTARRRTEERINEYVKKVESAQRLCQELIHQLGAQ